MDYNEELKHMRIDFIKIFYIADGPIVNGEILYKQGDLESVKILNIDHCCNKMLDAWTKESSHHDQIHPPRIGFGSKIDTIGIESNKIAEVYIRVEGKYNEDNMAIGYCPFCGQPIEVSEVIPNLTRRTYTPKVSYGE